MEIALRVPERPSWPFHNLPEPSRSVWQRFRNQYSQEQIEVVVNNWLAAHRTSVGLTEAEVHAMQSTYGQELSKKQFLSLFEKLLAYFKVPDGFTDAEKAGNELRSLYEACGEAPLAKQTMIAQLATLVDHLFTEIRNGNVFSRAEEFNLKHRNLNFFANAINSAGVNETEINDIYTKERTSALRKSILELLQSGVWSPDCDKVLETYAKQICTSLVIPDDLESKIQRAKVFWALENFDKLPSVDCDILLKKGEVCYFRSAGIWHEEIVRRSGNSSTRTGMTFRLVKGASLRSNNHVPIRQTTAELRMITGGMLYITNKRFIVMGEGEAKTVTWTSVLDIIPTENGFQIVKASGKSPIIQIVEDPEVALRFTIAVAKRSSH